MNATTRNRRKLYSLAGAGLLALTLAAAGPAVAKDDKPYQAAPNSGSAKLWHDEEAVTADYLYVCRIGSAIKYRIEPREAEFFDLGSSVSQYRLAPRLGTCA